ncbi:glyoxalase [Plesiomonas shigelloides]|uniref:VOC family protein n=1 Tax=Plesiomonas shigelloides TaxID=703 RepID=UPI000D57A924|nr:VOC family protein [Plesiomonas shigelloides]MCX2534694.1 VOC family protein [Plesiomonas shigelloides]PVU65808.1 glyoxalase [Plesiomonas shigelloides]
MVTPVISGDGIFSHVFIGAVDVEKSASFYDAVLDTLGINNLGPFGKGWVLYGREKPAFIIARPGNGEVPSSNGITVGFAAAKPEDVDAFHAAGLANGGTDEGLPGPRGHLPGAYAAYLRDPAGNKITAYTFI